MRTTHTINSGDTFGVYAMDAPRDVRTYRAKLEKRKAELGGFLVEGQVQDWADYQRRVGVIQGIDEALRVCDDIEKEAEKR